MVKSEERVSSEESSAPVSRSHAQQQQVTTRRRVRAPIMVQEGSVLLKLEYVEMSSGPFKLYRPQKTPLTSTSV